MHRVNDPHTHTGKPGEALCEEVVAGMKERAATTAESISHIISEAYRNLPVEVSDHLPKNKVS